MKTIYTEITGGFQVEVIAETDLDRDFLVGLADEHHYLPVGQWGSKGSVKTVLPGSVNAQQDKPTKWILRF